MHLKMGIVQSRFVSKMAIKTKSFFGFVASFTFDNDKLSYHRS